MDSSKIQLKRYKSGHFIWASCIVLICFLMLWAVAFPWYLVMRYKIKNGTAILKDGATDVAA